MKLPPALATGHEDIDRQHRGILEDLDAAALAARADDPAAARSAITRVGDHLVAHFAAEESAMEATRYPERGRHKAAHDLFMQDFAQLVRDFETQGLSVPVVEWLTARVPEWVKFHIQVNDVPLGRYLASKRVRAEGGAAGEKPRRA